MYKQFLLLIILLVIRLVAIAQTTAKDSLLEKLKLAKEDTVAVQLYLDIGELNG